MYKNKLTLFIVYSVAFVILASKASATHDAEDEWRKYSEEPNGDIYFFDTSRIKTDTKQHRVWIRIRYKRSVMGASSYQSLLEIDCLARTERILQRTFFSDKYWEKPAMNTDKRAKPKRIIKSGSALERLSEILCNQ